MGLKEDILNDLSDSMAKEIDFHVIAEALGWTSVKLKRFNDGIEAVDIIEWMNANCTGQWKNLGTRFIFEKRQDAEWFSLRWL
jgi:hypothetical protein